MPTVKWGQKGDVNAITNHACLLTFFFF